MAFYLIGSLRLFACTFFYYFVLQSAGQSYYTCSFFVFLKECFPLFDSGGAHFSFQFFEILVYYFAGFLMADSRLVAFQYIFDSLCEVVYRKVGDSHT